MTRLMRYWTLVAVGSALFATSASAQAPDIRNIRPAVMLAVDTSGSMERQPACVCTTLMCTECNPSCTAGSYQKNRWATMVEAFTGSWETFTCSTEARDAPAYVGQPDYRYFIPHNRLPGTPQLEDGILDGYLGRVKFGLMTFDGMGTVLGASPLVERVDYEAAAFLASTYVGPGAFSYGERRSFTIAGCVDSEYMMDNGARSAVATSGALVSVGNDVETDYVATNGRIQSALLGARPFGPTPIAGMLDDVRHYFNTSTDIIPLNPATRVGDPYFGCRSRYVIMVTDGYPNADMRDDPYDCAADSAPGVPGRCPYQTPEAIAADLCRYDVGTGSCAGVVDGVFVIGFDLDDPAALGRLNDIAGMGGTGRAFFANDLDSLRAALSAVLDQAAPGATTRTVPAFASTGTSGNALGQAELSTGFRIHESGAWSGVLERRRYECNASLEPESQQVLQSEHDLFHEELNRQPTRRLLTAIPRNLRNLGGHLIGADADDTIPALGQVTDPAPPGRRGRGGAPAVCGGGGRPPGGGGPPGRPRTSDETGVPTVAISTATARAALPPGAFGVGSLSQRDAIINWLHGTAGSGREGRRLGDIYHSSPVVIPPPSQDLPDESYNAFRQKPEVADRPSIVYVGSNDGILHAFVAQRTVIVGGPNAGTYEAGTELWGFVPPMMLGKIDAARSGHQWMVDGTPMVKDVFYRRLPGAAVDGNIYHTVLVVGMRAGGAGYLALDVTDPFDPKFLWQFAHPNMGATYGAPALAQVLVESTRGELQERAIAFLPGGRGTDLTGSNGGRCGGAEPMPDGRLSKPIGCPSQGRGRPPVNQGTDRARANQRCWDGTGRQLFFVDLATGELVRQLDDTVFNAPLSGSFGLFTGDVGTITTRAYISDADGIIWRIDVSTPSMRDWDAAPLHDMFWDADAADGQPAYFPPIISTNLEGQVVLIQATGDLDSLEGLAQHRVVSITEEVEFGDTGSVTSVGASVNWDVPLAAGQQVTGPLELFDGKVYFATFQSTADPADYCAYGRSELWGVQYLCDSATTPCAPPPGLESTPGSGTLDTTHLGPFDNEIIMGVAVTQRPNCFEGVPEADPYFGGSRFRVTNSGGGGFELVANVGGGSGSAGSTLGRIVRELPAPVSFTRVQSWAGTVD